MQTPEQPSTFGKANSAVQDSPGWEAALRELRHQAAHLEARGAHRAAVTLYDAVRIAALGGLNCGEHPQG